MYDILAAFSIMDEWQYCIGLNISQFEEKY